jgi:VCBS repeat-containing protein
MPYSSVPARQEIVFIAGDLIDIQQLIQSLQPGTELHLLDPRQNSLMQMAAILAGRSNVDAIHLLSHGGAGQIQIGSTILDSANLRENAAALAAISSSLSANGDILLYGCNVAEGSGKLFVDALARLTGADVAASTDLTGEVAQGGNWVLEYHTGVIDASLPFLNGAVAGFHGVLAVPNSPPQGTSATLTFNEDTPLTLGTADFGFTDPVDTNNFLALKITALPSLGALKYNGTAVTVDQVISTADITLGKLVYTPVLDANGKAYTSFDFKVQDDGGTASGGLDLDPTARTLTFDVTSVNDAPLGISSVVTMNEDSTKVFTSNDFGFSDTHDTPANTFVAVKITAISMPGSFKLDGVAVNVGDTVTTADIDLGKLAYTPTNNANGNSYASFNFKVQDDGGTLNGGVDLDPTARTLTFNVTPLPDPPVTGAPVLAAVLEDTLYPSGATVSTLLSGKFSDIDGNTLAGIAISADASVAGEGTWQYSVNNGVSWTAVGGVSTISALALNPATLLRFVPALNYNGAPGALTVHALDNSGSRTYTTVSGIQTIDVTALGSDLDAPGNSLTTSITAVNDPSVIVNDTITVSEDNPASGNVLTNDSDVDNVLAVATFQIAGDGTTYNAGDAPVIAGKGSFTLAADGTYTFTPVSNWNGTVPQVTYTVNTGSSGKLNVNVSAVNDVPTLYTPGDTPPGNPLLTATVATIGGTLTFSTSQIQVVDPDNTTEQLVFRLESLPTHGELTFNGKAVSTGSVFSYANLGQLVYTHDGYQDPAHLTDTFNVTLRDTAGGTVASTPVNISITSSNHAPTGIGNFVMPHIYEDHDPLTNTGHVIDTFFNYHLVDQDLGAVVGVGGIAIVGNTASSLTEGIWQYSTDAGATWSNIGIVSDAAGSNALVLSHSSTVRFVPALGYYGGPPSLSIRVLDNTYAGLLSVSNGVGGVPAMLDTSVRGGGTAISDTANTIGITVYSVDDDPTLGLNTGGTMAAGDNLQLIQGGGIFPTLEIANTMLRIDDVDSGVTHRTFTLTNGPLHGAVGVNDGGTWKELLVGAKFTQADIDQDKIRYIFTGTKGVDVADSFNFTVTDGDTRIYPTPRQGGIYEVDDVTLSTLTFSLTINGAVTQPNAGGYKFTTTGVGLYAAPTAGAPGTLTLNEGDALVQVTEAMIPSSDSDTSDANLTYSVVTTPTSGVLYLNGGPVGINTTFTRADVLAGKLKFSHGGNEDFTDGFTYFVTDGTTSTAVKTLAIDVTPVNDRPELTASSVTVSEGSSVVLHTGVDNTGGVSITAVSGKAVTVRDVDGVNADKALAEDTLTFTVAAPANGEVRIEKAGQVYNANNAATYDIATPAWVITQAEFTSDKVFYWHNGSETTSDTVTFTVNDNTGAANATASASLSIKIAPVNNDPVVSANTGVTLAEGATTTISNLLLSSTDPDNTATQRQFRVTTNVAHGQLKLSGVVLGPGSAFTQDDIDKNRITYVHDGLESTSDSFAFKLSDGGGGNEPAGTFNLTVTQVNDPPVITVPAGTAQAAEDQSLTISGVSIADPDSVALTKIIDKGFGPIDVTLKADHATLALTKQGGVTLTNSGTSTVTLSGTLGDVNDTLGTLKYTGVSNFNGADTITIDVNDKGNIGGGPLTDTKTIAVIVSSVNDTPTLAGVAAKAYTEDASAIILASAGVAGDVDLAALNAGAGNWGFATLTISRNGGASVHDQFSNSGTLGALTHAGVLLLGGASKGTVTTNAGGTLTLAFADGVTTADVQSIVHQITYNNIRQDLFQGQTQAVTLNWVLDDGDTDPDRGSNPQGTGGHLSTTVAQIVTVTGINDAPVGNPATNTAIEDGVTKVGTLTSTDVDSVKTAAYTLNAPLGGLTLNSNGNYSFDPTNAAYQYLAEGQEVDFIANYTVTDDQKDTGTSTLTITVTGVNDAPVGVPGTANINEDTFSVSGVLTSNDVDVLGKTASYTLNAPVAGLTLNPNGNYTYTQSVADLQSMADGDTRTILANYTVTDDKGATGTSTLTITVTGLNDAPVAQPAATTAIEDGATVIGSVTSSDVDIPSSASYALNAPVAGLTLNSNGSYSFDPANAAYQYLAAGEKIDVVSHYTVTDDKGATGTSTLTITVTGINDSPVAQPAVAAAIEDGPIVTGALTSTDADVFGKTAAYSLDTPIAGLTLNHDGSYSFDPSNAAYQYLAEGQTLDLVAHFTVTDDQGATGSNTLTITVTGVNDLPVPLPSAIAATEDGVIVSGTVTSTDVDILGKTAAYTLSAPVSGLTLNSNGSYSFDPSHSDWQYLAEGQTLDIVAHYTVTDDRGATATSTITITVTGMNDAPVAQPSAIAATEDGPIITGALTSTDVDILGKTAAYTLDAPIAGLTLNHDGSYSFDPSNAAYHALNAGETRDITAHYTVTDDHGATGTSTLTITVTGISNNNSTPTLSASSVEVSEASPYAVVAFTLDGVSSSDVTFNPLLVSGSATAGIDTGSSLEYFTGTVWSALSGAATIHAGATTLLVRVPVVNDTVYEGSESLTIASGVVSGLVTNPAGASGTVTILDDGTSTHVFNDTHTTAIPSEGSANDDRPTISVSSITVSESQAYAVVSVSLSNALTSDVSFTPSLAGDTATYGLDFGPSLEYFDGTHWGSIPAGGVTIAAGNLAVQLRTPLVQDSLFNEGTEHFLVGTGAVTGSVHNPSGASGIVSITDMKLLADPVITDVTEGPSDPTPYDLLTIDNTQVVTVTGEPGCAVSLYKLNELTLEYEALKSVPFTTSEHTSGIYTLDFGTNILPYGKYEVQLAKSDFISHLSNSFTIDSTPGLYDITARREVISISDTEMATIGAVGGMDENRQPTYWNGTNWIDSDGETIRFSFNTPASFSQESLPSETIISQTLSNGSRLSLNTRTGAYTYYPVSSAILDTFTLAASDGNKGAPLVLTFDAHDTLDRDGIGPNVETRLAALGNLAGGSKGDLNNDGIADANQNAVTTFAWTTVDNFRAGLDGSLTDTSSVISLQAVQSTVGSVIDESMQIYNAKVLDPTSAATGGSKPSNAAWDPIQFSLEPLQSMGFVDADPSREGIQIRMLIDISRSMTPVGRFVAYEKYVNADAVAAGVRDLDGNLITTPGWYDFTQRVAGGDGARFITSGGYITGIELTITDNAFGDNNMTVERIYDPGVPIVNTNVPIYRVDQFSGDRMLFLSQTTAQSEAATRNTSPRIDFYGVSDATVNTSVLKAWHNTLTGDYFYAPEGVAPPYECYVEVAPSLGNVLKAGMGVFDVHLYMNSKGITQIMGEATATGLGLIAEGYKDMGVLFASSEMTHEDVTAPTVGTFTPNAGAADVPVGNDIVLNFSEAIKLGTGTIALHSGSATGTVTTCDISISGTTLTINPVSNLSHSTHYFVTLAEGSVLDLTGNHFSGSSTYEFSTGADPYAGSGSDSSAYTAEVVGGVAAIGLIAWLVF